MRRGLVFPLVLASLLTLAPEVRAQDLRGHQLASLGVEPLSGPRAEAALPALRAPALRWRGEWERFRVAEGVFTGVMGSLALASYLVPLPHRDARWQGGVLGDDAVRRAFVLRSAEERNTIASVSDGLLAALGAAPFLIDAVLTAWVVHGESDVAAQMMLVDMGAHALAQATTAIFKWAVRRERPIARGCREDAQRRETDPSCDGSAEPDIAPESFISGHTSMAFTSAALICMHHTELGLLGPAGDAAMCATGLTLASTVGLMRIMSDRHYLSDVLMGATIGMLSGWLVPWLLHYAAPVLSPSASGLVDHLDLTIAPVIDENQIGLSVLGRF